MKKITISVWQAVNFFFLQTTKVHFLKFIYLLIYYLFIYFCRKQVHFEFTFTIFSYKKVGCRSSFTKTKSKTKNAERQNAPTCVDDDLWINKLSSIKFFKLLHSNLKCHWYSKGVWGHWSKPRPHMTAYYHTCCTFSAISLALTLLLGQQRLFNALSCRNKQTKHIVTRLKSLPIKIIIRNKK